MDNVTPIIKAKKAQTKLLIIVVVLIILLVIGVITFWHKASVPKTAVLGAGQIRLTGNHTITVPISINTDGYTINAAQVKLAYDPGFLTNVTVSKAGSIFNLWIPGQPSVDASNHQMVFEGGVIRPGFKGTASIGSVSLSAKHAGHTTLIFSSDTEVLLADGKGTIIPLAASPITVSIP
ncbi:MAG: hypothetical protein ACHQUB_01825 [Candidatus Saccharimonadia bacterium]